MESPAPASVAVPAVSIDWMAPATRAAQYREIDSIWGKLKRGLRLGKGGRGFYTGGDDAGSVRRYRQELEEEEEGREGQNGGSKPFKRLRKRLLGRKGEGR